MISYRLVATIDKVIGHSGVCQKCEHGTQIMLIEQMTADL